PRRPAGGVERLAGELVRTGDVRDVRPGQEADRADHGVDPPGAGAGGSDGLDLPEPGGRVPDHRLHLGVVLEVLADLEPFGGPVDVALVIALRAERIRVVVVDAV